MATTTGAQAPGRQDSHAHIHPNLALAVIASAQLMVVLDATIVNIALPAIKVALGFSATGLSWVLNAYTLVFGGLLLLGAARVTCSAGAGCSSSACSSSPGRACSVVSPGTKASC